jgi:hypothetical protein
MPDHPMDPELDDHYERLGELVEATPPMSALERQTRAESRRIARDSVYLAESFLRLVRIYEAEHDPWPRPAWVVDAVHLAEQMKGQPPQ